MKLTHISEKKVLTKIQKRLQKVIRTYEKVTLKMETQLEKVNQLPDQQEVATLRETIQTGLDQSRKFLEKTKEDHQKIIAQLTAL